MAPEAIGAVIASSLSGIAGLILAWSGLRRTRNTQLREDLQTCWEEHQRARSRFLGALVHIGRLEDLLAINRIRIPARPPSLDPGLTDAPSSEWHPRHAAA